MCSERKQRFPFGATALWVLVLAALTAKPAAANTAITPVLLSWPVACFLLFLVIHLEALVARRVLKMECRRSLFLALYANMASAALGTAMAFALLRFHAFPSFNPLILLIPNFLLSVGCEYLVARHAAEWRQAGRWAWSANALSYSLLALLFAATLRHDYTASRPLVWRHVCLSNLRQINRLLETYRKEHDGRLPPAHDFLALARQLPKSPPTEILRCPASRRAYLFNTTLAGGIVSRIARPDRTPLVLDATPHPNDWFCVLFADGHARIVSASAYRTLKGRFR